MIKPLILLTLWSAFWPALASAQGLASRLVGIWEGQGEQNSGSSWTIRLTVTDENFSIEYPSLSCGGSWTLLSDAPYAATFFEDITFGSNCIDTTAELFVVDNQTLRVVYFFPGGDIEAYGILECSTCDAVNSRTLILPFFEVDTTRPGGLTTFLSVHNETTTVSSVNIKYFDEESTIQVQDDFILGSLETRSINVRDVEGLTTAADGMARGWILVSFQNRISGDYFYVDPAGNFATGDQLFRDQDVCSAIQARIVDFGSDSRIRLYVSTPKGSDPTIDDPSATIHIFDEIGAFVETTELYTEKNANDLRASDLTDTRFGSVVFEFIQGTGALSVEYSAFGLFSVSMNATCTASPMAPP